LTLASLTYRAVAAITRGEKSAETCASSASRFEAKVVGMVRRR
jgi:hypothetical protein